MRGAWRRGVPLADLEKHQDSVLLLSWGAGVKGPCSARSALLGGLFAGKRPSCCGVDTRQPHCLSPPVPGNAFSISSRATRLYGEMITVLINPFHQESQEDIRGPRINRNTI